MSNHLSDAGSALTTGCMIFLASAALTACQKQSEAGSAAGGPVIQVTSSSSGASTSEAAVQKNLATFDTLDFDVYSHQKWDRLTESHASDIVVTWPDGHETHGLAQHIEDLKAQFTYAPDTRISSHPIKIAVGEWSSVSGVMEGTFTKPMKLPDGKLVQPTNKKFKIGMVTIGHWTPGHVMDHEWLMWDNASFMKQIGIGG